MGAGPFDLRYFLGLSFFFALPYSCFALLFALSYFLLCVFNRTLKD